MPKIFFITDSHLSESAPSSRKDNFLDSICKKIFWISSRMQATDILLLGGDVFNVPHVSDVCLCKFISVLPDRVYTVVGNHDFKSNSKQAHMASSLSVLIKSGRVNLLTPKSNLEVGSLKVCGFSFNEKIEGNLEGKVIVIHRVLEDYPAFFSEEEIMSYECVEATKPLMIMAGHDHATYPITQIRGSFVARPGALSRGTAHNFNRVRDVSCFVLDADTGKMDYLIVPSLPSDEVFEEEKLMFIRAAADLTEFLDKMQSSAVSMRCDDIFDFLMGLKLPKSVLSELLRYLKDGGVVLPERLKL